MDNTETAGEWMQQPSAREGAPQEDERQPSPVTVARPPSVAVLVDGAPPQTGARTRGTARPPMTLRDLATGDRSVGFATAVVLSWVALVALPLLLSMALNRSLHGIPLFSAIAWVALLRVARWFSPPRHCESLLERGRYREALAVCERELSVPGERAWRGNRRLAWLNRTTNALLGLGRLGEASVVAIEALNERHDPETLSNLGLCLLYLNRYEEAAAAAREALSVTRERSVVAHAIMGAYYVRQGRPAEAQAAAQAGLADVEALLPFVRKSHHLALLAVRCQADRMLRNTAQAERDLEAMRKVAERNPALQADVLLEEADVASSVGNNVAALAALRRAIGLAPHVASWYATQPHTFQELRGDAQLDAALAEARAEWCRVTGSTAPEAGAAPPAYVAAEIAAAANRAHASPAKHASQRALVVQALTLAGTLALLVWWTWHFFLSPG